MGVPVLFIFNVLSASYFNIKIAFVVHIVPERNRLFMPECYTHCYVASQALMRSGKVVTSHPAFLAGANGPDPLYAYQALKKDRAPDLTTMAKRIQCEKTGAFLSTLVQLSMTSIQQSFTLGFLSHYAADCVLHPYVAAMSVKGMPYGGEKGNIFLESAIDSYLYYRDFKTYLVPLHAGTPVLITEDLAQVTSLLHESILQVYGVDIPAVALADTYHSNLNARKFMISKHGFKKAVAAVMEPMFFGKNSRYTIRAHMQPAKPLKKLPNHWENPYTHEAADATLEEMLMLAEQAGASLILAAMEFWLGNIDAAQLSAALGDNNYFTGLPVSAADTVEATPPPKNKPTKPRKLKL